MARLEFYVGNAAGAIAIFDDAAVPRAGEFINIRTQTYEIARVTWALDHADEPRETKLRANIILRKTNANG